jgi:hypothetical protein
MPNGAADKPVMAPRRPVARKRLTRKRSSKRIATDEPGHVSVANVLDFGSDGWYTRRLGVWIGD